MFGYEEPNHLFLGVICSKKADIQTYYLMRVKYSGAFVSGVTVLTVGPESANRRHSEQLLVKDHFEIGCCYTHA